MVVLGGCVTSALDKKPSDSAAVHSIDGCITACKHDHDACSDGAAAERTSGRQFGAAAQCDRALKKCFEGCRMLDPDYGFK